MKCFLYVICAVFVLFFTACSDNIGDFGLSVRPDADDIILGTDVFPVNSFSITTGNEALGEGSPVNCSADSLLLGEFKDPTYGTTRGEILAQFTAPTSFYFPANAIADSMSLALVFNTWKGSKLSPVKVAAYEMDKATMAYNTSYLTNTKGSDFCSKSKLLGSRIAVAVPDTITDTASYQPHLTYKFSKSVVDNFKNAIQNGQLKSQADFANFFKGIYLTSEYGNGSIWNIKHLYMTLYFHYHAFVNNKDTVLTNGLIFPASKDVRQIGLIQHSDVSDVKANIADTVTYATSPAGIYTQVNVPVGQILNKAKSLFGTRVINFNHAGMTVNVTNRDTISPFALKPAPTLLLVRKAGLLDYIKNYNYASDTIMIAAYNSTKHSYTFDLSTMLTSKLHKDYNGQTIPADAVEEMVLVPIEYTTASSSSTTITSLKPQSTLSGMQLKNNKCKVSPLRINIFYNGF